MSEFRTCPECHGHKIIRCPVCEGRQRPIAAGKPGIGSCKRCSSTGQISCATCQGTGRIAAPARPQPA